MEYTVTMFEKLENLISSPYGLLVLATICILLLILLIVQRIRFGMRIKKERQDAINRSRAVIAGQMTEQVAPFLKDFPCNPSDARFIGKPIDFVAFPGLMENDEVREVLLIEVKTGTSTLSNREKEVRKAVEEGRVRYVTYVANTTN